MTAGIDVDWAISGIDTLAVGSSCLFSSRIRGVRTGAWLEGKTGVKGDGSSSGWRYRFSPEKV